MSDRGEIRESIDQKLIEFVLAGGFIPVPIPNSPLHFASDHGVTSGKWLEAINPNGLILSGGNDIGDYPKRDETEHSLLTWAATNRIPVLGICRGMQMIAVWAGENLVKVEGHVNTCHSLRVVKERDEWPKEVNSFHNWSIAHCPPVFDIAATSQDGNIEAIVHKELPWEAWMWHPERDSSFSPINIARLKRLFNGK